NQEDHRFATAKALDSADALFVDCESVHNKARELADISKKRIVQFPWGLTKTGFAPTGPLPPSDAFTREAGTHVLICTRCGDALHGIDTGLEAFRRAYQPNSSLRLLLVGRGEAASRVHDFIARHKLENAIRPLDQIAASEIPKWFRTADVYISCSQTDGT